MLKIHPAIMIGIGPQAQQTIKSYMQHVRTRRGNIPAILSVLLDYSDSVLTFRRTLEGIQHVTLSPPVFVPEEEWPPWLPDELVDMPPAERERTRAWMRAAMLQQADKLQEFLLESIPHLSSFAAVEEMGAVGVSLAGDSEIHVYVIADLSDLLGSAVSVDLAYLAYHACHQIGLQPSTTGLFFLPSATTPAPAEEAIAYAALKELEHYFATRSYVSGFNLDWAATDLSPFQDGCYLVDNVNELGYTLEDATQQISEVSEWLYAMTLLDMQSAVREHRQRRYLSKTLRTKTRAYESFGMAIRYVPQVPLIEWTTAQLGGEIIDGILNAPVNGDPAKDASAFVARMGLDLDSLNEVLHRQVQSEQIEKALAPLQSSGFNQIESQARQILQAIRDKQLLVLDHRLTEAGVSIKQEIQGAIYREVRATLQDRSRGGFAAAERFLALLQEQISELRQKVEELSKRHRVELKQSLATISKTHYTLRSVMMGIPPWPVSVLSVFAAFILPFIYCLLLIYRIIRPVDPTQSMVVLGILVVGVLGVSVFVARHYWRQRRLVSNQHMHMIRERFQLESQPLFSRAIAAIYEGIQRAVTETEQGLEPLISQLQVVASQFGRQASQSARDLEALAAPGPFRSGVGMEQARRILGQVSAGKDGFLEELMDEIGYIADWEARYSDPPEPLSSWLGEQLSRVGARYVEQHVSALYVLDMMVRDASPSDLQRDLQRMLETARPLWNYDPHILRRAKTQHMTLIGVDTSGSGWANIVGPLSKIHPDVIPFDTGDPFAMAVLCVHRGMPLFALRRIGEYRAHYAESLWRSKLPVHTMRTLALSEDLIPFRRRTKVPTRVLFAVGHALGSIVRDADGRYIAPRPGSQTIRLSMGKERAVALMSMDEATCREVQRQLEALIASKSKHALHTILEEYMTVMPDLKDWEVRGILDFARRYNLEDASAD